MPVAVTEGRTKCTFVSQTRRAALRRQIDPCMGRNPSTHMLRHHLTTGKRRGRKPVKSGVLCHISARCQPSSCSGSSTWQASSWNASGPVVAMRGHVYTKVERCAAPLASIPPAVAGVIGRGADALAGYGDIPGLVRGALVMPADLRDDLDLHQCECGISLSHSTSSMPQWGWRPHVPHHGIVR
jgi:hypothetical protein